MRSLITVVAIVGVVVLAPAADIKAAPSDLKEGGPTASQAQVTLISEGETWVWPYHNIMWKADRFKSDMNHVGTEFLRISW